jgi:hypothetical protein
MTTVAGIFISAPTRAGTRTGGSGLATTQRVWRVMTEAILAKKQTLIR